MPVNYLDFLFRWSRSFGRTSTTSQGGTLLVQLNVRCVPHYRPSFVRSSFALLCAVPRFRYLLAGAFVFILRWQVNKLFDNYGVPGGLLIVCLFDCSFISPSEEEL